MLGNYCSVLSSTMIREPIYRYFKVGPYIACFLWVALHSVALGYVATSILYTGLCPDALNDPSYA